MNGRLTTDADIGHRRTLEYVASQIDRLGDYYHYSTQAFPAVMGQVFQSRLVLGHSVPESATPMSLTPPTSGKEPVYGDLVLVDGEGCHASDYPDEVSGKIAFIVRGTCSFGAKSELAGRAGAIAAVVFNSHADGLSGTLGVPSSYHVATFGLSGKDAKPIIEQLKAGKAVDSIAFIDSVVNSINTTNIIIQTAEGDPENCVMLGGHSDSVGEGPGINGAFYNLPCPPLSLDRKGKKGVKYWRHQFGLDFWWSRHILILLGAMELILYISTNTV